VLSGADLRAYLGSDPAATESAPSTEDAEAEAPAGERDDRDENRAAGLVDLLEIPGLRLDVANLDYRATLAEAQEVLNELGTEALCIRRTTAPLIETVLGVVTQQDIDNYRNPGA
jgi:hypothetical protein